MEDNKVEKTWEIIYWSFLVGLILFGLGIFLFCSGCTVRKYDMPITVTSGAVPKDREGTIVAAVPANEQTLTLNIYITADIPKQIDVKPDIQADITPSIIPK